MSAKMLNETHDPRWTQLDRPGDGVEVTLPDTASDPALRASVSITVSARLPGFTHP